MLKIHASLLIAISTLVLFSCKKDTDPDSIADLVPPPREQITQFTHPGILNTRESLDYLRAESADQAGDRYKTFQNTVQVFIENNPVDEYIPEIVYVRGLRITPTESRIRTDAVLSYAYALKWAQTGDSTYANKAKQILNAWARVFKKYDVATATTRFEQTYLEASWVAPSFTAAAEILRHYQINGKTANWNRADISRFDAFLSNLDDNYISKTFTLKGSSNWHATAAYADMVIGIYKSDKNIYNRGFSAVQRYLPMLILKDGTVPEFCLRSDCIHFQYTLTAFAYAAEMDKIQRKTAYVYELLDNRISAGFDYMRSAFDKKATCDFCTAGNSVFPGTFVANREYSSTDLSYLITLKQYADGTPTDLTFLGFTQYTHHNLPKVFPF